MGGHLPSTCLHISDFNAADANLFACMLDYSCHVLHNFLPPITHSRYLMRTLLHNPELPIFYNLSHPCFLARMQGRPNHGGNSHYRGGGNNFVDDINEYSLYVSQVEIS